MTVCLIKSIFFSDEKEGIEGAKNVPLLFYVCCGYDNKVDSFISASLHCTKETIIFFSLVYRLRKIAVFFFFFFSLLSGDTNTEKQFAGILLINVFKNRMEHPVPKRNAATPIFAGILLSILFPLVQKNKRKSERKWGKVSD